MVYRTDRDGNLIMFSPHGVKAAGYDSEEEMIGLNVANDTYLDPEERRRFLAALKEKGSVENYPLALKAKDGTSRFVLASSHFYYDDLGNMLGVEGILHGVTDLRKKEQELRESEAKFRTLFNNANDAIYIHEVLPDNIPGKVLEVNSTLCSRLGYSREELLTMTISDIVSDAHRQKMPEINEQLAKKKFHSFYGEHKRKDGSVFPVEINSNRFTFSGREIVLVVARDITERKQAEEELRQSNKKLNLLSSITRHDILNQLMALKGYLSLSNEMIDKPAILAGYIQKEQTAANAIERQITFTRMYQELGVAAPEWQNVNASINKAVSGLPMRNIRVDIDPKNPEIFADRLFEKVFYNLIDNALRYGGDHMKAIHISSQEIDTGLCIVCEDDGVGITDEDKKRLFTRGFGKNTGLGLFLSREILSITGITITETSEPGNGARFEMVVPKGAYRFADVQ